MPAWDWLRLPKRPAGQAPEEAAAGLAAAEAPPAAPSDEGMPTYEELLAEVEYQTQLVEELLSYKQRYDRLRKKLTKYTRVQSFYQPVLLAGPPGVGKSALLKQWNAPWQTVHLPGGVPHRTAKVPFLDFAGQKKALRDDPDVQLPLRTLLGLHVHDFPADPGTRRAVGEVVREETRQFRERSGKDLGVVLIFLFDAGDADRGIRPETTSYYNDELFREIRRLASPQSGRVERLIIVFNKYDRLRSRHGKDASDRDLLKRCVDRLTPVCEPLRGLVGSERVCEVLTILGRTDLVYQNQGAPIVLAEAARPLAEAFGQVADRLSPVRATSLSAEALK